MKKIDRFKKLLIANTVISVVFILTLVIGLSVLLNLQFPQRIMIEYMDQQMLNDGEGTFLILAFILVLILVPLLISMMITSAFIIYQFFYKKMELKYHFILNNKWYSKLAIYLFCLFYFLFPYIFVWFFYIKESKWILVNNKFNNLTFNPKWAKIKWILIPVFLIATFFISIISITVSSLITDVSKVAYRKQDLNNAYTISKNNPNTIVLYFDRGTGIMWNQLLMVDYLLFKNNNSSFIQQFPEFTSYVNSLSQSMVTNSSNPSLNGSWYMQPSFKNMDIIDPFFNCNDKQITMNEYYLNSYKSILNLLNNQGYKNFAWLNPPYYGSKTYELNANAYSLQEDLITYSKSNNKNIDSIISMDVTEIVKALDLKPMKNKDDEINFLHYFCASNNNMQYSNEYGYNTNLNLNNNNYPNLKISNNKSSTFLQLYFQTTHENYSYVSNDKCINKNNIAGINYDNVDLGVIKVTDPTIDNQLISTWYAIQKLKRIFNYLKKLPAYDKNRPWVTNQYDNCNLYIVSDHGSPLFISKELYTKVNKYLIKNNVMTSKQMDYLFNKLFHNNTMSFTFWNSIFLRKPAKYSINTWNKYNASPSTFFNTNSLYVNSDLFPIIEADIMKQWFNEINPNISYYNYDATKSWYYDSLNHSFKKIKANNYKDQEIVNFDLNNNFLFNPLNSTAINNRKIPLYYTNWLFLANNHKFQIYYKYYFINKYPGGIFNVNNFFLYKKY